MKNLQQFVLRRADILTLRTTLSPREAVERLRTYIEPPGISVRRFLPTHFLFVGEVRDNYFTLMEISGFGKRGSGTEIVGEIIGTMNGSNISISIRPLLSEHVIILLFFLCGIMALSWLVYLVFLGQYPFSCLLIPALLIGVVGVVLRSSTSDTAPAYATLEAHFRQIFMVTAPTIRVSDSE